MKYNNINDIPVFSKVKLSNEGTLIVFPESVVTIGLLKSKKILFVEQYRESIKSNTIELPGGKVEKDEDIYDAAQRELHEETGHRANDLTKIFSLDMDFSASKHTTHVFLGDVYHYEHHESILKVHIYSLEEAMKMIQKGYITHAPTISSILWLKSEGVLE